MKALLLSILLCMPRAVSADGAQQLNPADPVARAMKAKAKEFTRCYKRALDHDPKLKGKIVLAVELDKAGAVKAARVKSSTVKLKDVEDCFVSVTMTMELPPETPRTFDFPILLSHA